MAYDEDDIIDDEGSITRWVPAAVVSIALIGFVALAWYAYHSGTQSINGDDLLIVEADTSPIKETPIDPGGMKFPNQDKTVFETFGGATKLPPKVERVLPSPEEPMARNLDTSETKTWINDKLKKPEEELADAEQVVSEPEVMIKEEKPAAGSKSKETKKEEKKEVIASVAKPVEKPEPKPKPKPAPKAKKQEKITVAGGGTAKIQLGAYGSEAEARSAWGRISKKFPELKATTVYVIKADLGAKGVFHRLRAGNVGSDADAKALCSKLSARGQACMAVR